MKQKTQHIISWIFSGLALLFLLSGTIPKFLPGYNIQFAALFPNLAPAWIFGIALVGIITAYLIPKTTHIGFAFATSYLGGAAALAWMTMGGLASIPVFVGIIFLWIGHGLRFPHLCTCAITK
jgi:hypothetical protein